MTIREIAEVLEAEWVCGEDYADQEIRYAFASDMMSDVLAYVELETILLTGLISSQAVRTAEMLDIPCLVFVRGKKPQEETVRRAKALGLCGLMTKCSMFEACGRLYAAGLNGIELAGGGAEDDDD